MQTKQKTDDERVKSVDMPSLNTNPQLARLTGEANSIRLKGRPVYGVRPAEILTALPSGIRSSTRSGIRVVSRQTDVVLVEGLKRCMKKHIVEILEATTTLEGLRLVSERMCMADAEVIISAITECMNGPISRKVAPYVANIHTKARRLM